MHFIQIYKKKIGVLKSKHYESRQIRIGYFLVKCTLHRIQIKYAFACKTGPYELLN